MVKTRLIRLLTKLFQTTDQLVNTFRIDVDRYTLRIRQTDGECGALDHPESFSQGPMQYLADEGMVIYSAKGDNDQKIFDAPECLAAMRI